VSSGIKRGCAGGIVGGQRNGGCMGKRGDESARQQAKGQFYYFHKQDF
jgi:hypothetical protein